MPKLRFATICSSNMNRSMEAHNFLKRKGYSVESYGCGTQVKLPGAAPDRPNIYEFGTPYKEIQSDLLGKDRDLYTSNGIVSMLERNKRTKLAPERFQDTSEQFDIIVCLEERVYDTVVEHMSQQAESEGAPVHVINVDIEDNHEEATMGAFLVTELAQLLEASPDLDNEIDEILTEYESKCQRQILHTVMWY